MTGTINENETLNGGVEAIPTLSGTLSGNTTSSYNSLSDKPIINGTTLEGGVDRSLVEDVKVNGVSVVTDYVAEIEMDAEGITYDNSESDLDADNVQNAIDEVIERTNVIGEVKNLPQPIATFTDGSDLPLASLKTTIVPIQDLHGYDSPWVGGSGKNKLNLTTRASETIQGITSEVKADNTIVASGTSTGNGDITCPVGTPFTMVNGETYTISLSGTDTRARQFTIFIGTSYRNVGVISATEHSLTFTIAGELVCNQVMLRTSIGATVNINAKLQIEKGSTATSFESYENICPIIGWSGANVRVTGKNYYPINEWFKAYDSSTNLLIVGNKSVFLKAGTYTLSLDYYVDGAPSVNTFWRTYSEEVTTVDVSKQMQYGVIGMSTADTSWTSKTISVVISKDSWFAIDDGQLKGGVHYRNIQLEEGSTATTYEPYNGHTYTIPFTDSQGNPIEVFGGELDVVSGVLTVDRAYVDMGDLPQPWGYVSNGNRFTNGSLASLIKTPSTDGIAVEVITSQLKVLSLNDLKVSSSDALFAVGDSGTISVRYTSCGTDTKAIKTALTGVELVYQLATPITYQLTPTQVKSLLGSNNVWGDCGSIKDLKYTRNLNITINDLISRVEALEG